MSNTTGVAPVIQCLYPELDVSQLEIIGSVDGHVLAIAGPGAGKTLCMALRAVNILLQGLARPEEVLLHLQPGRRQFGWLPRRYRAGARLYYTQPCGRLLAGHLERVVLRPNFRLQDELQRWNLLHRGSTKFSGPTNGS